MNRNRAYYDAFSSRYDERRDRGYHRFIDDQTIALLQPYLAGKRVLEVGCGTGLLLERVAESSREAVGVDLSPGMLQHARERGLSVQEANCTALPFADGEFDVAYSFKVLAHVDAIELALQEMARVVRPGGHVIIDVYNRHSLRYLTKRFFGPRATSGAYKEDAITTRFDSPREAISRIPAGLSLVDEAGIRIVTAHEAMHRIPALAQITGTVERALHRGVFAKFAGFWVMVLEKSA